MILEWEQVIIFFENGARMKNTSYTRLLNLESRRKTKDGRCMMDDVGGMMDDVLRDVGCV